MKNLILSALFLSLVAVSLIGCSSTDKGEATQTMPANSGATAPSPAPGVPGDAKVPDSAVKK